MTDRPEPVEDEIHGTTGLARRFRSVDDHDFGGRHSVPGVEMFSTTSSQACKHVCASMPESQDPGANYFFSQAIPSLSASLFTLALYSAVLK